MKNSKTVDNIQTYYIYIHAAIFRSQKNYLSFGFNLKEILCILKISVYWSLGVTANCINQKQGGITPEIRMQTKFIKKLSTGEFPGGPVVRIWCFHCGGCGFNPWLGN